LLIGKGSIVLGSHTEPNSFAIVFHFGYVSSPPMSHDWYISHTALQDPDSVGIVFYRGARAYNISPSNKNALHASEVNGKARYVLPAGYFRNIENFGDSVLIGGTFNQP
jgi:hypothetical protein